MLKYVVLVPFTGVVPSLHDVSALLEPYLAVVVVNPVAVHPAKTYPVQLGLTILYAVLYVALLFAYVVAFKVQLLFPDVYVTV